MEDKQLDFNAPFLSVRRLSSALASSDGMNNKIIEKSRPNRQHSLPLYQLDFELGDVTKPAAVPFLWERIPGKAKDGSETQPQAAEEPSSTPRLPPGRVLDIIKHVPDEALEDRNVFSPKIEAYSSNGNGSLLKGSKKGRNGKEYSGLESEDDAFSDALDALSPTESFSWNCSVTGLSGYDGHNLKPSGTFSSDPQMRDFMMSRFLPAAKAMILETPQYISRKQPVKNERPKQVKKVFSGELRPLLEQYGSNTMSPYGQYLGDVKGGDEDCEHNDPGKSLGKACGFLPRLCVKNSLCLLNPVPGMKSRSQTPTSSVGEVRRLARSAYSGPLPQTLEKQTWDAAYRKKMQRGVQSRELHKAENKLTGESNRFCHSSDSYIADGTSPYRRSRGGGISPYRNEAPKSPFHNGTKFLGIPKEVEHVETSKFSSVSKGCDNFRDLSSRQIYEKGPDSVNRAVEKTLYIDSVNNVEFPNLDLISSKVEGLTISSGMTLVESRGIEESSTAKSFTHEIKCSNLLVGENLKPPKANGTLDADLPSSDCIPTLKGQADRIEGDQGLNGNVDMKNEKTFKSDGQGNSSVGSLQTPLTPPLPKSPSESWLWHTLPSISLRDPFSHLQGGKQFYPKNPGQKTSTTSAKWETIVKTSNVHHDHIRYSKELIPHVSQHSNT